ncbi:MAG: DUF721 domain-containing protein [Bacteroidales bacterium]|nr:DUF721 domain-containing protein [Bacteroidales bacterium]
MGNWEDRTAAYYIQRCLRTIGNGDFASSFEVQNAYRQVVGDRVNEFTSSCVFRNGTLSLKYHYAALRHEITMRRESLMQAINEKIGSQAVKKIVIR